MPPILPLFKLNYSFNRWKCMHLIVGLLLLLFGQNGNDDSKQNHSGDEENRYTVYIFLLDDCRISEYYTPELNRLHTEFENDSIKFIGLFPNFSSKPKQIEAFKSTYKISFPLKTDYYKTKTKEFDVKVTPEVVIFDHHLNQILYKGRIDNSYFKVGRKRTVVNKFELKDALNSITNGDEILIKETQAIGCFINHTDGLTK